MSGNCAVDPRAGTAQTFEAETEPKTDSEEQKHEALTGSDYHSDDSLLSR